MYPLPKTLSLVRCWECTDACILLIVGLTGACISLFSGLILYKP
jgi:hypothetical protein